MKTTLYVLSTLFLMNSLNASELAWVDEQVEAIKPPRKAARISTIRSPFVFLEKNGYVKPVVTSDLKSLGDGNATSSQKAIDRSKGKLVLDAIINKSIMVNGKWYKQSDKVYGYSILNIDKTHVTLKKGDKKINLSTNTKTKTLKFKNK